MAHRPLTAVERKVLATAQALPPRDQWFTRYVIQQAGWPEPPPVQTTEIQHALRVLLYRGYIAGTGLRGTYKLTDEGRRYVA